MTEAGARSDASAADPPNFLKHVAVLILTYNEAENIGRILSALSCFEEIVVLDSESDDETPKIVSENTLVRMVTRKFDDHAAQWNFGLREAGITRDWVLALDADYLVPEKLIQEISHLKPAAETSGYEVSFRYCIHGRPLFGSLYPPHVVLFRRDRARYVQFGHTQRLVIDGRIVSLSNWIDHDDRKPLARWLQSQQRYARLEADYLLSLNSSSRRPIDRIRLTGVFGPLFVFMYTLVAKRCILAGWPGWFYVLQRTLAELMITTEIIDRRLRNP